MLGHWFSACHVQILKAIEMVTDAIHDMDRAKEPFGNAQGEVGIQHFLGIVNQDVGRVQ